MQCESDQGLLMLRLRIIFKGRDASRVIALAVHDCLSHVCLSFHSPEPMFSISGAILQYPGTLGANARSLAPSQNDAGHDPHKGLRVSG